MKPALTAEEWAFCLRYPDQFVAWTVERMGREIAARATPIPEARPHMAAALCLHNQPYGFTREDVTWLRANKWSDLCQSIANRIEALLPPEDLE